MAGSTLVLAAGSSPNSCSQAFPHVFTIDDQGHVIPSQTLQNFTFVKTKDAYVFHSTQASGDTRAIRIDLQDGKAVSYSTQTYAETGEILDIDKGKPNPFQYTDAKITYKNGRCYVDEVSLHGKLVANTQMCHELYRLQVEFLDQCKADYQSKVAATIKKYGGIPDQSRAAWVLGLPITAGIHIPSSAETQARAYMNACEYIPSLNQTMTEQNRWDGDPVTAQNHDPAHAVK